MRVGRAQMIHRARVERAVATTDDHGHETRGNWGTHLTSQPCRYYEVNIAQAGEQVGDRRSAMLEAYRLQVPLSADVTETDRITRITNRQGVVIDEHVYEVENKVRRQSLWLLGLRVVR